jgi:hypothetical protein
MRLSSRENIGRVEVAAHRRNARVGGQPIHDHLLDVLKTEGRSLIVDKGQFVLLNPDGSILSSGLTLSDLIAEYYAVRAREIARLSRKVS